MPRDSAPEFVIHLGSVRSLCPGSAVELTVKKLPLAWWAQQVDQFHVLERRDYPFP